MNTLDAIIKRKSVKSFTNQQVDDNQLKTLIHAANSAPISGGGRMGSVRHLTIIQNKSVIEELSTATAKMLAGLQKSASPNSTVEVPAAPVDPLYGTPTLIVISTKPNIFQAEKYDAGIAIQNISIAATDMGLNSVVMMGVIMALANDINLSKRVEIPDGLSPMIAIAVGYTDDISEKIRHYTEENVNFVS